MIQIAPQMRILVAVEAVDFRKGIDGLARICREHLQSDLFSGWLYVFRNRRGMAIKRLTSHLLGEIACRIARDWERPHEHPVYFLRPSSIRHGIGGPAIGRRTG